MGNATLSFSARDRGTLSYVVNGVAGTKSITRQLFGTPTSAQVPSYGDMWWVPAESGWGVSISQQYRQLFVVWYAYRNGVPTWYVMPSGTWTNAETWTGTLYRTSYPGAYLGTGFDTKLLLDLRRRLDAIEIPSTPFSRSVGLPRLRAHWVKPEVVVQVAFLEWTGHGKLRHPRLLGVRFDRNARDVVRE